MYYNIYLLESEHMFWYNYFMDRDFSRLCTQDGYHHRGHSKAKPLVHLVFVTKYRKLILTGSFGIDVKQILFESSKRHHLVYSGYGDG